MSQSASAIAATIQNPDREMTTTERISQLETMVVQLCEGIAERDETIEAQQAQLDDQQEQLDDKQAQINDLKAKLETETERRKSVESELEDLADDCDWLNEILFELEDDLFGEYASTIALNELGADSLIEYLLEDHTDDAEATEEESSLLGNPLRKILQWPRNVVERELTKNEALARKVAEHLPDLAKKTGKGYVITSRMIGNFFVSDQGERLHTQTVARIIDFLVRFAGEHVEVSKKHGRKRLAFDEELVAALHHDRGDIGNSRGA